MFSGLHFCFMRAHNKLVILYVKHNYILVNRHVYARYFIFWVKAVVDVNSKNSGSEKMSL